MSWWKSSVIYQIYPRSFFDSNNDGIGDLNGVIEKIPYLKELGVDVLWLSPFFPSPNHDFGYDISDYVSVGKEFGTLNDFDSLIQTAHQHNIKVILDGVFNHTSTEQLDICLWRRCLELCSRNTKILHAYFSSNPSGFELVSPPSSKGYFEGHGVLAG